MTTSIHLQAGNMTCELRPDLGGCIAGLWLAGEPVLRSTRANELQMARRSGCYPLIPFSNRVGHGTLQWNGTGHPLVVNNAPEPHAIHGVGWQRAWSVLDEGDDFAVLSHEHRADASWPFAYDASQTFRLTGDSLEMTLSVTNQSATVAPMGLGWHPFFFKRPQSHVSFSATGRWEMADDKLPTHREPSQGMNADCAGLVVDHCFDGWSGSAELTDEFMRVNMTSPLTRVVVCTDDKRDFVAIEPVSHVNNAMSLVHEGKASAETLGLRVLAAGESMSIQMKMKITTKAERQT